FPPPREGQGTGKAAGETRGALSPPARPVRAPQHLEGRPHLLGGASFHQENGQAHERDRRSGQPRPDGGGVVRPQGRQGQGLSAWSCSSSPKTGSAPRSRPSATPRRASTSTS